MAQARVVLDKDQFNCPICLDMLKDPVTIPCGHNYCSDCIQNYWDQDNFPGVFVCPQCRKNFNVRPLLSRNTMLADVVERFRTTGLQEAPSLSLCFAGTDDVECDVCSDRKHKAVKSCLVCLASYCDVHVEPHYVSAAFQKHKLVSASKRLQEKICSKHGKLLEVYCRTDKQCVCYSCLTDDHRGHDTVLAEEEVLLKQREVTDMKQTSQITIREREKTADELRDVIFSLTRSARAAAEHSKAVFTDLIRLIELKRFEVIELIEEQEKTSISQAEQLLDKVKKEITDLKMKEVELDDLANTEDHISFLQSFQSLPDSVMLSDLPALQAEPHLTFHPVMTAVSDLKKLLKEVCQEGFVSIYERVRDVVLVAHPNPDAQLNKTCDDGEAAVRMEAAEMIPPPNIDQSPVIQLNPCSFPGLTLPTITFSPFGSKLSTSSRQRHFHRRAHPRRK